jgi:hypothetical protein
MHGVNNVVKLLCSHSVRFPNKSPEVYSGVCTCISHLQNGDWTKQSTELSSCSMLRSSNSYRGHFGV